MTRSNRQPSASATRSFGGLLAGAVPDLGRWIRLRRGTARLGGESIDDLVQSVCREALEARAGFEDLGDTRFRGWMRTLTERKLSDRVRHWSAVRREAARREQLAEPDVAASRTARSPVDDAHRREAAGQLRDAIERLPRDQAAVLRLQVDEELSNAEVAARLGKSEGAVRILRSRGLARVGRMLAERRG
ncbi:MAG: sigma-70 family RNA polymerase sigma factor [Planctomycetota bacterium]